MTKKIYIQIALLVLMVGSSIIWLLTLDITPQNLYKLFEFLGLDTKPILNAMVFNTVTMGYKKQLLLFSIGVSLSFIVFGFVLSALTVEIGSLFFIKKDNKQQTKLHKSYIKTNFAKKDRFALKCLSYLFDLALCICSFYTVMAIPLYKLNNLGTMSGLFIFLFLIFLIIFKICKTLMCKLICRIYNSCKNKFAWR